MADPKPVFIFGPFVLDPEIGLFREERLLTLPPKELALLQLLVQLQGRVASHQQIEQHLWPEQVVSYAALAHCVYSLRRSLGPEGKQIVETVPKRGYRLSLAVGKLSPSQVGTAVSQSISAIPLAYSHYGAGVREANSPRPAAQDRAVLLFEEAARVDPGFAAAHAAVADTRIYQLIRGFLKPGDGLELGVQACHRALDINPRLVQGHAALGWFQGIMMRQFDTAHASLDLSLSIDPDYSRGHIYRSWVYRCQAQSTASIEAAQRAMDRDPHALLNRHSYCWALFLGGRVKDALDIERILRREYPQDDIAQGYFAILAAYLGNADEALEASSMALQLSADVPAVCAAMAYVLARVGDVNEAKTLVEKARTAVLPRAPRPMIAPVYVQLGDEQLALKLLQEARDERCPYMMPARLDPRLKKLESDARFVALFAS